MKLRDRFWLWGTVVNALQKDYGFPESRMRVGDGLRELGLSRAMMCGFLPPTEVEYADVSFCDDLLWEMSFDEGFAFDRPLAPIVALRHRHPNVRGVLLDDFSTTEISRGATPDLLARFRESLPESMELWIVVYSMSLDIPNLADYLEHVDGVSFWAWHARELREIECHLARCHELSRRKPTVLGAYFYDFGDGRPLSSDEMTAQLERGTNLIRNSECEGLCLLSSSIMDVGLEAVDAARRWVEVNSNEQLG